MKKILLVDDEDGIIRFYENLLIWEGYRVLVAKDADEGLMQVIKTEDVDLILLDINMSDINGDKLWEAIQEYNPQLNVMVFSVCNIPEQKKIIPYADDYFDKSQSIEILLKKIDRILNDKEIYSLAE